MERKLTKPTPEKKITTADNARKFLCEPIDPQFLSERQASSFVLTVDWLQTGEDNEQKLAHKKYDDGDIQILLISKVTKEGNRTAEKTVITHDKYEELLSLSVLRIEKTRYELDYEQQGAIFLVKYDKFFNSDLCVLEVEPSSVDETTPFNIDYFPIHLEEVSGDTRYVGYRVAEML